MKLPEHRLYRRGSFLSQYPPPLIIAVKTAEQRASIQRSSRQVKNHQPFSHIFLSPQRR
jgi:hypothetical protein